MKRSDRHHIRAILFDLGDVLIDIDFYRCARIWSDHSSIPADTLASRFRMDAAYKAFECGAIDAAAYYAALRRQLGLNLSDDVMRAGWNAIICDEKPGIRDGLERLAQHYPLYVLTNTNPEHEIVWARTHRDLLSHFRAIFVSSRMGCRKPDITTYFTVARSIALPCSQILFLDDSEENIQGARQAGMHAIHVSSSNTIVHWIDFLVDTPDK